MFKLLVPITEDVQIQATLVQDGPLLATNGGVGGHVQWPYEWVTVVIILLKGLLTPFII